MTKISNQYSLTNILTADLANSRLGINNVSPTVALDVVGITKVSSSIYASRALFDSDFLQNETSKVGISFASGYGQINSWGANTSTYGGLKFQLSVSNGNTVTPLSITPTGYFSINGAITSNGLFCIKQNSSVSYGGINLYDSSNNTFLALGNTGSLCVIDANYNTGSYTPLAFNVGGSERMRITSGGQVLINRSSAASSEEILGIQGKVNSTAVDLQIGTNGYYGILFRNVSGGAAGNIQINSSSVLFTSSSDYRLKEDLKEIKGLEKVSAIKVYDFKWKNEELRTDGVLAHELAEVLPYAVTGIKDGDDMQGVDYSKLVPVLVKAIQELSAENTSLINRIEALENK
jgi:hypothetical protein